MNIANQQESKGYEHEQGIILLFPNENGQVMDYDVCQEDR
jgi:hypothetical protein